MTGKGISHRWAFIARKLQPLIGVAILFGAAMMVLTIASPLHPMLDLVCHTAIHMFCGLAITVVIASLAHFVLPSTEKVRSRRKLLIGFVSLLFFSVIASPWTLLPLRPNSPDAAGLQITSWNVLLSNRDLDALEERIRESDSDLQIIIELSPRQHQSLLHLEQRFEHAIWIPDGAAGIAVLSKITGTKFKTFDLADVGMPAVEIAIPKTDRSRAYTVLAIHTRSPSSDPTNTILRDRQLDAIAEWALKQSSPVLIVGDFNITPWSPSFRTMLKEGRLEDSRLYRGNFASWPSSLGDFGIPIDHAILGNNAEVVYRSIDDRASSSDHRAIKLTIR